MKHKVGANIRQIREILLLRCRKTDAFHPAVSRFYNPRQGATRKSSRCRREIAAKHPVTTQKAWAGAQ